MGLFDRAADNFEKRQKAADYNYRAREYISSGQKLYEDAYVNLQLACMKTERKVKDHISYKQKILNEINNTLKKVNSEHSEYKMERFANFIDIDVCAVHQNEQLDCIDKALATWVTPSISDFFGSASDDYYAAKRNLEEAKAYKSNMRAKRDEINIAKEAVRAIPDFLYEEQRQINELMDKFRKTAAEIEKNSSEEKAKALCDIAQIIADSLSTQFIDNNYHITNAYMSVSNQFKAVNNSLSGVAWLN